MTTPVQADPQLYQPSPDQLARAAALKRFNRLYIYLPLAVFSVVGLVLVGLLLWGTLSPNIVGTREFVSGLADLILILAVLPMMLLCAIVPAAYIAWVVYRRQQPQREHGRFQTLIWRLDSLVTKAQDKTSDVMPKVATPVIKGHSWLAYLQSFIKNIKRNLLGDKNGPS